MSLHIERERLGTLIAPERAHALALLDGRRVRSIFFKRPFKIRSLSCQRKGDRAVVENGCQARLPSG